jgi:glycosyltransferase involved in cell wall biosynthesis
MVKFLSKRASHLIAASSSVKQNIVRLGVPADKISVVYNSVDLDRFNPELIDEAAFRKKLGYSSDVFLVGLVGQLSPWKGHRDFIKAARIVSEKHGDIVFPIVGALSGSDYERELRSMVEELGLSSRVVFTGWYERAEEVYCGLDVTVLATTTEEPFGLVVAESMACGTPVVATRVGGVKEIVEDGVCGLLVEPNNPTGMAEAIIRLREDSGLRRSLGAAGKRRVELFSLNNIISQLGDIYTQYLNNRGSLG